MPATPNVPANPPQMLPDWRPPETEEWSIPPILTDEYDPTTQPKDLSIRLRQGIVCEVQISATQDWMFQNVNQNEDDIIDFSLHGDPNGIWGRLNPGSFVKVGGTIYFINRTHKDVLYLATFKQNDII